MNLGAKIKQLREDKGWTQGQLATYSGITRSYISVLESGVEVKNPGSDLIVRLSKALGIDEDVLLEAAGIKRNIGQNKEAALEDYRIHLLGLDLTEEELAELKVISDALFGPNGTRRNRANKPPEA